MGTLVIQGDQLDSWVGLAWIQAFTWKLAS